MLHKITFLILVLALGLLIVAPVAADAPNFGPALYADGEVWGTKGTTDLPPPNEHNRQSFDKLFMIEGQDMAVAEAAPGNPAYNGGRWTLFEATWADDVTDPPTLTSYEEVMFHIQNGDLTYEDAETYFQCPLLPVK